MDLYYVPVSGNSARSVFALNELGAPFVGHALDVQAGANKQADYLAINPMGKVPALIDGDVRLWESNAINWYAAEKHPEARLLPPTTGGRASVQRWLFFQTGHLAPACRPIFMATSARVQQVWGYKGDPAAAEAGRKELGRYLPVIDAALEGRDWLEGAFSLADVAYAPHFWLLAEGGHDLSSTPRLRAWLDRLFARPAWKKTLAMTLGS